MQATYRGRMDALSVFISTLCIIHCIVLPLFVSTLSILNIEVLENFWLELTTVILAFLIGGTAIFKGYLKYHRKKSVLWLFVTGMVLMVVANSMNESTEVLLKLTGGVLIVCAHIHNYRHSQKICACCK
jgi:hypothetical protein